MTDPIEKRRRVPNLRGEHVHEAVRALNTSHGELEEDSVLDALWIARALPVALDALEDTRSGRALKHTVLRPMWVERGKPTTPKGELYGVATYVPGSDRLEVEVTQGDGGTSAVPSPPTRRALVRFRVVDETSDGGGEEVTLRRFSMP